MAREAGPDAPDSRNALENVCGSRSRSRGEFSLGGEPFDAPRALRAPDVAEAVVEAVLATFPELDPARPQRIATPIRWQRHVIRIPGGQGQGGFLQNVARPHDMALSRRERRQLRAARARGKVVRR